MNDITYELNTRPSSACTNKYEKIAYYLKNYKIFESVQDSIDYIQDIFLDLRDNYFEIEIRTTDEVSNLYHRVIADHLKTHYLNTGKILPNEIIEIMVKKYPENLSHSSNIHPVVNCPITSKLELSIWAQSIFISPAYSDICFKNSFLAFTNITFLQKYIKLIYIY